MQLFARVYLQRKFHYDSYICFFIAVHKKETKKNSVNGLHRFE